WNTGTGGAKLRYVSSPGATSQIQLTDLNEWLMSIAGNNSIGLQFRVRDVGDANDEATLAARPRMSILRSGNVGIGTSTPGALLDVAGDINTTTGFNIAGNRVLSVTGAGPSSNSNTFGGVNSGSSNIPGNDGISGNLNTFFGSNSGNKNTTGGINTFLGAYAGYQTTTGAFNTYLG